MPGSKTTFVCKSEEYFACLVCDGRRFKDLNALHDHYRKAEIHNEKWCERCKRLFVSASDLKKHQQNSAEQVKAARHHCSECERAFDSSNELEQHRKTHIPRDLFCTACEKKFATVSATALHQETGTCESGATAKYIHQLGRMIGHQTFCRSGDDYEDYPFECPECATGFRFMSALLQHAESPACDQDLESGPLARFCGVVAERTEDREERSKAFAKA